MQVRAMGRIIGLMLCGEAIFMLPPLFVALYYGQGDAAAFLLSMGLCVLVGLPMVIFLPRATRQFFTGEAFALVGICWVGLSLFGALPFYLSGSIPSFVDALFESVSGFSTTGASILRDVEALPKGLLFWRSLTHWVGGMGVLVLTMAVLPKLGARGQAIMQAESPGPTPSKLVPRLQQSAKLVYAIYAALSVLLFLALLVCGMPVYDAMVNTFATAGTGGFSVLNSSIAGYNSAASEMVIALFMCLFGVNFALYFALVRREYGKVARNRELHVYIGVIIAATLLITANVLSYFKGDLLASLRSAFFQVASVISTTGFATVDYSHWPTFSHVILVILMLLGACAGSTSGGIKIARVLILLKSLRYEVQKLLHPRLVRPVMIEGKALGTETMRSVLVYFFAYALVLGGGMLVVALDNFDFVSTFTSVVAAIGNIGPGLGVVGPAGSYAGFSALSKIALSICMLVGRLEIMPVILLLFPSTWQRV